MVEALPLWNDERTEPTFRSYYDAGWTVFSSFIINRTGSEGSKINHSVKNSLKSIFEADIFRIGLQVQLHDSSSPSALTNLDQVFDRTKGSFGSK